MDCSGTDGFVCCDGYFWDESLQACTECTPGFVGIGCSIACPFPLFGAKCIKTCFCPPEDCNVSIGCPSTNQYSTFWTTRLFEKTTSKIGTEDTHRTTSLILQYSTSSTTVNQRLGESNQNITNSPIFWGLFICNGTILLLVATYIFYRLRKTCTSKTIQSKNADLVSTVHISSAISNRESSYVATEESNLVSHYNQIYNEIEKSSSEEESSSVYNQTIEILREDDPRKCASKVYTKQETNLERNNGGNRERRDINELYLTVISS
ncbi:uncharacterized protein LOC134249502 [Saccostrea cucullata]|uniref:uncharacterized protein LOC134249502 n=1 Tax=Saccostrea cuccullata TaxID=36930 RepID=UPI002ED4ADBB